jgi:hypothetical protein
MTFKLLKLNTKNNDVYTIVDSDDFDKLSQTKWYLGAIEKNSDGSAKMSRSYAINSKHPARSIHRFVLGLKKGDKGIVDHINHDTLDNRKSNLRLVSNSFNGANRFVSKNNKHGLKGVHFYNREKDGRKSGYKSVIRVNGKRIFLGMFDCKYEAAKAYDKAATFYFGQHALLNF